jgi:hypothetical protein
MDGQFDGGLHGKITVLGITLHTASNDEHVPEIECHIRAQKEKVQSVYTMLPFHEVSTQCCRFNASQHVS